MNGTNGRRAEHIGALVRGYANAVDALAASDDPESRELSGIRCRMVSRRSLWALGRSSRWSRVALWGRRSPALWWECGGWSLMVSPAMVVGV